MQRYNHAFEALRMTRSRGGILSTTTTTTNRPSNPSWRSRGGGGVQDLQPCPSFPSEADSLQSHPTNTLGSDSSVSEQSSIESYDDGDYSYHSSLPTRNASNSEASTVPRRTPLTLIQELSFSLDLDDGSAENNHPSAGPGESAKSTTDCKPAPFSVGTFLGVGGVFRRGTGRTQRYGLFDDDDDHGLPSPQQSTELREASIRAIHNRSVLIESPKTVHRRNFFSRRPPTPPTVVPSKVAGRKGPLNDASSHNRNVPPI